jgi:hypothetical protein
MNIEIELNEFTKPIGTYLKPMLNIGYMKKETGLQKVYFNDEEEITELYDRYKYDIQNDWGSEELPSLEDFLYSEHIYILLGCVNGEGHEVLYS